MTDLYRCPTCDGNGHINDVEEGLEYCHTCSDMVPVEPDDVDTILRYCLPLITERQVRAVVTLLGVGGETP